MFLIGEHIVDRTLVECQFSSIVGNLEHIILMRLYQSVTHCLRPIASDVTISF